MANDHFQRAQLKSSQSAILTEKDNLRTEKEMFSPRNHSSSTNWETLTFKDEAQGNLQKTNKFETRLALFDTHVFLLNEYFIELNTANFNILNKVLN